MFLAYGERFIDALKQNGEGSLNFYGLATSISDRLRKGAASEHGQYDQFKDFCKDKKLLERYQGFFKGFGVKSLCWTDNLRINIFFPYYCI